MNTSAPREETNKNNIIHVRKSDFEVFEALAMDLASNTATTNANNSSCLSGSPPGTFDGHGNASNVYLT